VTETPCSARARPEGLPCGLPSGHDGPHYYGRPRPRLPDEISFDYVRLDGFIPTTWDALRDLFEALGAHVKESQPTLVTVECAAASFFVLRFLPESYFPGGKWATIQHLEGLIEARVQRDLGRADVGLIPRVTVLRGEENP